jgi:hypothetical protein
MNSITQSLTRGRKCFLFLFILCSLALTNAAVGGTFLIYYYWNPLFHPFTNSPGSATIEAEWIVYPGGLAPANNFYLTSTTPHMVNGSEILFFYFGGNAVFKLYGGTTEMWLNPNTVNPYIGTRVILGETHSVMRYRFSNVRTAGPNKVKLTCNNHATTIAVGTSLPQSTIYVNPYYAFPSSGTFQVVSSAGAQNISYTGTTTNGTYTTSFTGCTGGTGTLTQGSELDQLSGNSSTATHFKNSVYLWNFSPNAQRWDFYDEVEFDRPALLNDCGVCGNCGFWGPTFESNIDLNTGQCQTGDLPLIGVLDWSVSVDGGPFVQGNASMASLIPNLNACGQTPPYEQIPNLPFYQWIIRSPIQK